MSNTISHQLNPKKMEEYEKERISRNSPHHVRHCHAESKKMKNGYKRTRVKAVIRKAIINDNLEELSTPFLKSLLIPYGNFNNRETPTLKVIVEGKLKQRIDRHGANKRWRQEYSEVKPRLQSDSTLGRSNQ